MKIIFENQQTMELPKGIEAKMEEAVAEVLESENHRNSVEVGITFMDNVAIRQLNSEFRGIDRATDVLSFPIDDDFDIDGNLLLGDIVLSVEKAAEQALEYGHDLERELIYLTVHSMLHLLGYDHMEEDEKREMRTREKEIMKRLSIFK